MQEEEWSPVPPGFRFAPAPRPKRNVSFAFGCLAVIVVVVIIGAIGSSARGCRTRSSPVEANGETKCWNDCLKDNPYPKVCPECMKAGRLDWTCIEVQDCKDAIGDICLKKCP